MTRYNGKYVRFYLGSDDFSTAVAVALFDENGTAVTLGPSERLVIHTLVFTNGATARTLTLFDDADADGAIDAGEELSFVSAAANQSYPIQYNEALVCGRARLPKVKASGGSVGSAVHGTGLVVS